MLSIYFALYHHIIYVHFNILAQLRLKHSGHYSLIGGPHVFQLKGHYFVMVIPNRRKENSLFQLRISGGSLGRCPISSSKDGLLSRPPTDLSEAGGKGPLGKPCLGL